MLITTCVYCGARFRVTPQQLNAKQGQVRCGRCSSVFNGFEALERHPDDDTGSRLLAAREAAARTAPEGGIETLPVEDLAPSPAATPPQEATPVPPQPVHAEPARPRPLSRPDLVLPPLPPRRPPARAWTFGAALLAMLLSIELVYAYRGPIAQRYPVVRPWLEALCVKAGCSVAWSHDESLLKLEDSELLEVPGKPSEISLTARIRNLAPVEQEFPHIELTLTDVTGQAAIRRVLRPVDYLGRAVRAGEVLAAGGEMSIQLRLETPRTKATGYELLLFYP
jgi:predicted Zn finger-like uncharacterized protein